MPEENNVETPAGGPPEDDFAAYEAWAAAQDSGDSVEVESEDSAAADEPESESAEEETPQGESAEESETSKEDEQEKDEEEEESEDDEPEEQGSKGRGVQKRISKLTQKIRELEGQLASREKKEPEVAEPKSEQKEAKDTTDTKPVAPKLADYDTYEEYEKAHNEYVDKLTDWKADQKEKQRQADAAKAELDRAVAEQKQAWDKAASRFDDFNEVVSSDEVKISAAMEAVLRSMDPETGTALTYFLGTNPEESLRIAQATLANNEAQWRAALARAGRELGKLEDKMPQPGKKAAAEEKAPAQKKPPAKAVTAAPKPPARVGGARPAPKFDTTDGDAAEDYAKWERARNAELRRR